MAFAAVQNVIAVVTNRNAAVIIIIQAICAVATD